jgi:DnaK suppressor protein
MLMESPGAGGASIEQALRQQAQPMHMGRKLAGIVPIGGHSPDLEDIVPLTPKQRSHLEKRLKAERALALELINRNTDELAGNAYQDQSGSTSRVPFHPADLGTDTIDEEIQATNATRVSLELAEIDAALERLYTDPESFGKCEDTGRDIPFERLDIIPWARTCGT